MRKVISMIAVAVLCICALGATARQTETDAECLARMLWGEAGVSPILIVNEEGKLKGLPENIMEKWGLLPY